VLRRPLATFAGVFAAVVLLDQASKQLVRTYMAPPGTSLPLLGHWLRLTYVRNAGAAFGMLPGRGVVFMGVSVLVLTGVGVYLVRVRPARALLVLALGLVASGATGNLIDRAVSGLVTDFVQVPFDFPVFNLADSAIFVGVSMLVWWVLFGPAEHGAATGVSGQDDRQSGTTPGEE
jgi:signal peptidase II